MKEVYGEEEYFEIAERENAPPQLLKWLQRGFGNWRSSFNLMEGDVYRTIVHCRDPPSPICTEYLKNLLSPIN
jgi:hypothetical protein